MNMSIAIRKMVDTASPAASATKSIMSTVACQGLADFGRHSHQGTCEQAGRDEKENVNRLSGEMIE